MKFLKKTITLLPLAAFLILSMIPGCKSAPKAVINTQVSSTPEKATVSFKGKEIGVTPVILKIEKVSELLDITAKESDLPIIETRVRFIGADHAEVIFKFGTEPSALIKKLGLRKVLVFDYSENATFDSDKFFLKSGFKPLLTKQANLLNKYFSSLPVYICGHTDETGPDDYNLSLSLKRAQAVADYLVAQKVDRKRLKVQGFGKDYPIANNEKKKGRALNRRTEILLPQ